MDTYHQLIYNGSNIPGSPIHSPTNTPSPTTSPSQTSPSLSYTVSHGVPTMYGNNMPLFPFPSKIHSKLQQTMNHSFGPHPLLNQSAGPPGQALPPPGSILTQQPPLTVSLSTGVSNPLSTGISSLHWQQQLLYAQSSRQSASPHHHARQAAAAARNNSSAVAITDPNNPNKPPVNGVGVEKSSQDKKDRSSQWKTIDLGGMGLKNISNELFRYTFLTTLYIKHNNLTRLSPEIAKLRRLTVLDVSGNKLTSLPPELGMVTRLRELLVFDNLLMTLPYELGTLYRLEILGLEGNPISEPIKSMLQKEGTPAVIQYLRDSSPLPQQPAEREWISLDNDPSNSNSPDVFTLLSYNVLCEKYATSQHYGYIPSWALAWNYRKDLILQDVLSYNADIVCLQEVDTSQYEEFFKDQLRAQADYDSVYWPKSRAKTMSEWEKKTVDGCATFFKASKYTLIDKQLIEFNQVALQRPDFKKTDEMFNRVITKDNIAIVTLLENKETQARLIVANCHIHWDPSYADVKLVQVAMLTDELEKYAEKWCAQSTNPIHNYSPPTKMSTIICGDFNSTPESGVYDFLSHGTVQQDHHDFGDHVYGTYTSEGLSHRFSLKSAYANIEELPFTNFTPSFTGVIDYIWYTTHSLTVTGLLGGIDKEYVSKMVGFPNVHFPSESVKFQLYSEACFLSVGYSTNSY
ncbi:4058_t:CDS:2 [Paraglomus occultum]|uniref:CCR4-Not complex 3'-5'-exoribonuclease subunit Ccr4 n=1 Tax=Paraglomus occultum TaxID=144539 RepID=A0A9N9CXH8_9GLOM|nr:4058_t:CDS:2 [Paraglomus occultum]